MTRKAVDLVPTVPAVVIVVVKTVVSDRRSDIQANESCRSPDLRRRAGHACICHLLSVGAAGEPPEAA